jgi:hypothetical protein
MTGLLPTTLPSFNSRQSGCGCALMSPRPNSVSNAEHACLSLCDYGHHTKASVGFPWKARASEPSSKCIYLFSVRGDAYFCVHIRHPVKTGRKAFNVAELDPISAVYFSIVTFATVGYGDIIPTWWATRIAVSLEILASMAFVIFLFSLVTFYLARNRPTDTAANTQTPPSPDVPPRPPKRRGSSRRS